MPQLGGVYHEGDNTKYEILKQKIQTLLEQYNGFAEKKDTDCFVLYGWLAADLQQVLDEVENGE